jgi:predicted nuclease of predicted toxin-antitoxin system
MERAFSMRILLDECVPRKLSKALTGHTVQTTVQAGFAGLKDKRLMSAISGRCDVFITVDRNLRYQQNLTAIPFAVVVLAARSTDLIDLLGLVPQILKALPGLRAGDLIEITDQSI